MRGFDIASGAGALGYVDPKLFSVVRNLLGSQNKDYNFLHRFTSPLSVRDGQGNTLIPGSYERIAGNMGRQLSDIFRDLQMGIDEGTVGKGRGIREAQNRLEYLTPALEAGGFPGLAEEAKRHLQEIENEFYRQASNRSQDKKLTQDQRDAAGTQMASFSPKVKPYERAVGQVVAAAGEAMGKEIPDADFAVRRMVDRVAAVNSILKLKYNIKSSVVNLVQPLETLWPRVSSADYAAIVAESLKPSTKKRLQERGVLDGPTKLEGDPIRQGFADPELTAAIKDDPELMELASFLEADWAVKEDAGEIPAGAFDKSVPTRVPLTAKEKLAAFSPFSAASGQNRAIGYLYGELDARRKGMVDPEQIHQNGLAWAEVVEFDNSIYNMPPVMRDTMARMLFQYKGFTIKAIENLADLLRSAKTPQERAARLAKWGAQKGVVGGAKAIAAPLSMVGVGSAAVYFAAKERAKEAGLGEDEAERVAQAMYFGAPSMLGMDLSGSVTMLDEPFGNTASEQAVNFLAGPTVGSALTLEQMRREGKPTLDMVGRISPYVKQARGVVGLADMATGRRPPEIFGMIPAKDRKPGESEFGTRPATLPEATLKSMAITPSTGSAAGVNLQEVKKLQADYAALLIEQAGLEDPTVAELSPSETKSLAARLERVASRVRSRADLLKEIEAAKVQNERLRSRARIKRGMGLGALSPTPLPTTSDRG